ncbi:proline-rich protein 5-like [Ruditapes philippinarum]|uniref:proline-rich protein 5-like n=1 Tax=Ruditapes philippinarum TaxID=129788 RepID=UPI00295BDA27|nr:proline-rich protein 5-like [Ruditapes philippinarum]
MDYLQSGVRTLKRHSISNITDAIRSHIHRDSFSGLGRHLFSTNKADLPLKNAAFASVSTAIIHLFQKKKLQENELSILQESVRNLTTTEAGPLIYDYYKDKLIKKGMVIIREQIKHETGLTLLTHLGEEWDYFYGEILPVLYALLHPVETKTYTIKQVSLLEFRNTVLLKLPIKDALPYLSHSDPICAIIKQMLLVLHGVHENPYTLNYIALEKLVSRVTSPHLGVMGLYNGGSEPILKSNYRGLTRLAIPVIQISNDTHDSDDKITSAEDQDTRTITSPQPNRLRHNRSSVFLQQTLLSAVNEQDRGQIRRNSIATT